MNRHPVFDDGILDGVHLLEADAGTGKTWTIAGLVVRALIEREIPIERILVVTFTNAATAELVARIRQRLAQLERLLDDRLEGRRGSAAAGIDEPFCVACAERLDDERARRARSLLRIALASVDEMAVYTIHGYCQRVIDEHALSIGVARGLPIGAGRDERIVRRVADWWRAEVLDASPERLALFGLAKLSPPMLLDAVKSIAAMPLARIEPRDGDWRATASRLAALRASLAAALRDEGQALREWLAEKGNVDRRSFSTRNVDGWLAALREFCDEAFPVQMPVALQRLANARFDGAKPPSSIPDGCDALLAFAEDLRRVPGCAAREIAAALDAAREADLADAASLGFDDLLRLVRDALADPVGGPALARSLRERHPIALIDECQDTDALQWEIVRRVHVDTAPGNGAAQGALILVGDPKQAIYAFRGADLHSYLQAREAARRRHRLGENQRSSRALIEVVNALFGVAQPFLVDGIDFEPAAAGQRPRRSFEAGDAATRAPMTIVRLEEDPQTGPPDSREAQRQAVRASVAEIGRLLGGDIFHDGRALRPRDIAVLVQTHRQGTLVKRALAAAGIGAAEVSRESVLDTLECAELLRIVAAVAEPADPARLRSALATTLLGMDAQSLSALADDGAPALQLAARFVRTRDTWERFGPLAALRPLFAEHETGARLGALRDGDRRLTNLMHLLELLGGDELAARGPAQAIHAWARLRAGGADGDAQTGELRLESDDDLVRILTVHKSKGLEFPIVFLPFAWSGQAPKPAMPSRRHERDEAGRWQAVLDFAPSAEAQRQAAREAHAENLRALYVALTRAEQRCYVFWGATRNARYAPLAWLLHGCDPSAPADGDEDALDAHAVACSLERWRDAANARHAAAASVVDASALVVEAEAAAARGPALRTTSPAHPAAHPAEPGSAAAAGHTRAPVLQVRPWRATIAAPVVTTSFSAIAASLEASRGLEGWRASDFVDRPDHDEQAPVEGATPSASPPTGGEAVRPMRFRFPAGAQAGICLHGVLEECAFDAPPAPDLVERWLARCGFANHDPCEVAQWLAQVLGAPLSGPLGERIELSRVPATRQIREMDFHLHGTQVSDRAVLDAVAGEFPLEPAGDSRRWSGFLRGFIDLVFEHGGRYYLLDWKSNHLGDDVAGYAPAALDAAMRAHAYPLQACLYVLALHRWLRRTVVGYDYGRHFGGVFYVFLRGAGLEAARGAAPGVHASRPSARLVATLERLFRTDAGGGGH